MGNSTMTLHTILKSGADIRKEVDITKLSFYNRLEVVNDYKTYYTVQSGNSRCTTVAEKKKALAEYKSYGDYLFFNGLSRTAAVVKFREHVRQAEKELNSYPDNANLKQTEKFGKHIDKKISILCREISLDAFKNRYKPVNAITGIARHAEFSMYRNAFFNKPYVQYVDENGKIYSDLFKVMENENIIPANKDICYPWVYAYSKGVPFVTFISFAREYSEDFNRLYGIDLETYLFYRIDGHTPDEIDMYKEKIKTQSTRYFFFEGKWYSSITECIEVLGLDNAEINDVKKRFGLTTAQALYYVRDNEKRDFISFKLSSKNKMTDKERTEYLNMIGVPYDIYSEFKSSFNGSELNLMRLLIKNMYLVQFNGCIYRNIQEIFDDYGYVDILPVLRNVTEGYSVESAIELVLS